MRVILIHTARKDIFLEALKVTSVYSNLFGDVETRQRFFEP